MITQRTRRLFVVLVLIVRWSLALWFVPAILIDWLVGPNGWWISARLNWYLICAIWSVFLLSITWGKPTRTVLMLAGIALLAVGRFASFMLWPAGLLLIAGVLLIEIFPHLRKMFASFRETYKKISTVSET